MRTSFIWFALALCATRALAQDVAGARVPNGWQMVANAATAGNANPPLMAMGATVHLLTDRSGRYFRAADTLADSGIATVAFLRAPGNSGSVGLYVATLDDAARVEVLVRSDDWYSIRADRGGVEVTLADWAAVPAGSMSGGNPRLVVSVGDSLRISINGGAAVTLERGATLAGRLRAGLVNVGPVNAHVGEFTLTGPGATMAAAPAPPASKPNASLPAWSPDGRSIAFALRATAEGFDQIHVIDADGTHERELTSGTDNNTGPVFSPDGTRVAYRSFHFANPAAAAAARNMNDVSMKIMSVGRDGTGAREIAAATIFGAPKWSPDSRELLFSALTGKIADANISIDVADALGAHRRTLGPGTSGLSSGSWAPDNRSVAFVHPTGQGSEIQVQRRDGSASRTLSTGIAYQQDPLWSHDGKRIAFMGSDRAIGRNGAGQALYVVRADGSDPRVIIRDAQHVANVSLSLDGRRLLFQDMRGGSTSIYSIATDGSDELRLTDAHGLDESPSWSPDGRRIVFQSDRDAGGSRGGSGIFVMDARGGAVRRVR